MSNSWDNLQTMRFTVKLWPEKQIVARNLNNRWEGEFNFGGQTPTEQVT